MRAGDRRDAANGGDGRASREERAAALKERVYVTFTALAVVLALGSHPEDTSPGAAALTLFVTVLGTLLAVFLADLISHLAVNTQLPTRSELGHMYRITFGALGTVTVPLILVGLSALDVMSIEAALRASTIVLLVSLILVSYIAVRRIPMPFWQRAVVLLAEGALGAAVVALELLAHG